MRSLDSFANPFEGLDLAAQRHLMERFARWIEVGSFGYVEANQPQHLTLCKSGGGYKKIGMIGGEQFTLLPARMSKTGPIIRLQGRQNREIYEVSLKSALVGLDGMTSVLKAFCEQEGDTDTAAMRDAFMFGCSIEDKAHQEAKVASRAKDERFGSW